MHIVVHDDDMGLITFRSVRAFDEYVLGSPEHLYERHFDERAVMTDLDAHGEALIDVLAAHETTPGASLILDLVNDAGTTGEIDQALTDARAGDLGIEAQQAITTAASQVAHNNAAQQVRRYWPGWHPDTSGPDWSAPCSQ